MGSACSLRHPPELGLRDSFHLSEQFIEYGSGIRRDCEINFSVGVPPCGKHFNPVVSCNSVVILCMISQRLRKSLILW
jgi:hypothetical protein